jgi:hypothetical protein
MVQSTTSAISHWPTVNKVAFWMEDQLTMKIIKIALGIILIPTAIITDLVNKAIIYIVPEKRKTLESKTPKITWGIWLKNSLGLDKVTNIWTNHKPIIIIIAGLGLAALAFYQFKSIRVLESGYKDPAKNIKLNAGNDNITRLEFTHESFAKYPPNLTADKEHIESMSKLDKIKNIWTNNNPKIITIAAGLGLAAASLAFYIFKGRDKSFADSHKVPLPPVEGSPKAKGQFGARAGRVKKGDAKEPSVVDNPKAEGPAKGAYGLRTKEERVETTPFSPPQTKKRSKRL